MAGAHCHLIGGACAQLGHVLRRCGAGRGGGRDAGVLNSGGAASDMFRRDAGGFNFRKAAALLSALPPLETGGGLGRCSGCAVAGGCCCSRLRQGRRAGTSWPLHNTL